MAKTAAFFDIDGTISREGLISEMFKKMIRYDLIDDAKWVNEVRPAYLGGIGDWATMMIICCRWSKSTAKPCPAPTPSTSAAIARKVIEQKGDRAHTFSRDRIMASKPGSPCHCDSGSPVELVEAMSEKYGMDDFRGHGLPDRPGWDLQRTDHPHVGLGEQAQSGAPNGAAA